MVGVYLENTHTHTHGKTQRIRAHANYLMKHKTLSLNWCGVLSCTQNLYFIFCGYHTREMEEKAEVASYKKLQVCTASEDTVENKRSEYCIVEVYMHVCIYACMYNSRIYTKKIWDLYRSIMLRIAASIVGSSECCNRW